METVTLCPTCSGTGQTPPSICPTCLGGGVLLTVGDRLAAYPIPLVVAPGTVAKRKVASVLTVVAGVLTTSVTLLSLGKLVEQAWPQVGVTFWQPGLASLAFGVSGLLSMGVLSAVLKTRMSSKNLSELTTSKGLVRSKEPVNLTPYASSRFNDFLSAAAATASSSGSDVLEENHILLTLLEHPRIQLMLARLEIGPQQLVEELKLQFAFSSSKSPVALPAAQSTRTLLILAFQEALTQHFPFADLEDILLAYLKLHAESGEAHMQFLTSVGVTYQKFLAVSTWYAGDEARHQRWKFWTEQARSHPKGYMNRAWTALPTPLLDSVGKDLTLMASYGHMSEGTSRQGEVEKTLDILSGGTVKNVLLIGEAGAGKTSILKAIATRMLEDNVPENLRDKRLVEVDLNQLLTQGQSTSQLQTVIEEVVQAGNVILAIPEVKVLAGDGEALDGSTILASSLKNGAIQVISTANYADYHRYVEQNSTLKSQLQTVELHALEPAEVLPILEAYAGSLEATHNVTITYPAIEAAANLAPRYLAEQPAPAGAKQLLETACKQAKKNGKSWVRKKEVEVGIETLVQVPVQQAGAQEAETLLNLETTLHEHVVGQEIAVKAVSEALRRARAGLRNDNRPIGSFLFVGPTGVGKTELAKALCESYFGPETQMLRFDMSEYQSVGSVSTLIGTPETQGGTLTQAVREKPFSLILFDELEKAHPDILNLFLQVLDDGRLTEASGRTISFRNAIIIATSNAQARKVGEAVQQGAGQSEVMQLLEANFKPEFLNRFDGIIPFMPLTSEEVVQIAGLLCQDIIANAATRGITLTIDADALTRLAELGFDPLYGARPLRRIIEQKVEGILAKLILEQQLGEGSSLQITRSMLD